MAKKITTKMWIERANKVHNNKYDYSLVEYVNNKTKVKIICNNHGYFYQLPSNHCAGNGCPECSKQETAAKNKDKILYTNDEFVDRLKDIHGNKYDYQNVNVFRGSDIIEVICYEHGIFKQKYSEHLNGKGCYQCGRRSCGEKTAIYNLNKSKTTLQFIDDSKRVHGDKYDYSKVKYKNKTNKVEIICPIHKSFLQRPENHLQNSGCPSCGHTVSNNESKIVEYIKELGLEVIVRDRTILKGLELDVVIPSKKIAIEYNGLLWHSEKYGKDSQYHKNKTDTCRAAGYRLIHIWEDSFNANPERELRFIKNAMDGSKPRLYARKVTLKEMDKKVARDFLDEYHIQGGANSTFSLGGYHNNELVSVTQFKITSYGFELVRHACKFKIHGILPKVTKHFVKEYMSEGMELVSFCDLSRHNGKSYYAAGFELDSELAPDYKYLVGKKLEHKFGWRRNKIEKVAKEKGLILPEGWTETSAMRDILDIPRVYDCGKLRFVIRK